MSGNEWEQGLAYVKKLRLEGHTDEDIRLIMLAGGWLARQVQRLLAPEAPPSTSGAKGRSPGGADQMTRPRAVATVLMLLLLCGAGCQRPAAVDPPGADICAAAQAGDTDEIKRLLAGGLSSNVKGPEGYGPLHFAANEGQVTVAELLLGHGADVDAREDRGRTPLHLAAQSGHKEVVKLLVDYGADVHAKDDGGCTPVDLAATTGPGGPVQGPLSPAQPVAEEGSAAEVHGWQLWVADVASGEKQFVASGLLPLWSPDGSLLAFDSDGGISVWDGESVRLIARMSSSPAHFAWTSDSRHLIVAELRYLGEFKPERPLVQVSVADPGLRQSLGPGHVLRAWPRGPISLGRLCVGRHGQRYMLPPPPPRPSPSEVRQVMREEIEGGVAGVDSLVANGDIDWHTADEVMAELDAALKELDQGNDDAAVEHYVASMGMLLASASEDAMQDGAFVPTAHAEPRTGPIGWTGDGRVLLIVAGPAEPPAGVLSARLMVEPAGGGESELVCELPTDLDGIHWTSDLSRLAIVRDQSGMEMDPGSPSYGYVARHTLKILDLRTKAETDLGQGQYPHWSPNGKSLLYAEPISRGDSMQKLYVVDPQGGNKRLITQARVNTWEFMAWSRDSRRVAYSAPPSASMNGQDAESEQAQ